VKGIRTRSIVDVEKRAVEEINFKPHLRPTVGVPRDGSKVFATSAPRRAVVSRTIAAAGITRTYRFADNGKTSRPIPTRPCCSRAAVDGNIQHRSGKGELSAHTERGRGEGLSAPPGRRRAVGSQSRFADRRRHRSQGAQANAPVHRQPGHVYFVPGGKAVVTLAVADRPPFSIARSEPRLRASRWVTSRRNGLERKWRGVVTCAVGNEVAVVTRRAQGVRPSAAAIPKASPGFK
jgi:hypothetical protein